VRLPKDSLLRKYDEFGRAGGRRNTPAEIVDILNKGINAGLADPKLKARLAELGGVPTPMTLTEFGKHIADDTKKWGKVIRAAHIKAE
jgi:tripartite-type tricarboxylate transporter receptor subunit TctC